MKIAAAVSPAAEGIRTAAGGLGGLLTGSANPFGETTATLGTTLFEVERALPDIVRAIKDEQQAVTKRLDKIVEFQSAGGTQTPALLGF